MYNQQKLYVSAQLLLGLYFDILQSGWKCAGSEFLTKQQVPLFFLWTPSVCFLFLFRGRSLYRHFNISKYNSALWKCHLMTIEKKKKNTTDLFDRLAAKTTTFSKFSLFANKESRSYLWNIKFYTYLGLVFGGGGGGVYE